jgi:hypothetical protein
MSVTCHSAVAREKSMMERLDDHTQSIKIDLFESWCREGELNPHSAKHRRILSPLRLPVPPSRLFGNLG